MKSCIWSFNNSCSNSKVSLEFSLQTTVIHNYELDECVNLLMNKSIVKLYYYNKCNTNIRILINNWFNFDKEYTLLYKIL